MPYCTTESYQLAVERVFLHHNRVDSLRIPEGQETEATRATSLSITHHGALDHFAKLREVVLKRLCSWH